MSDEIEQQAEAFIVPLDQETAAKVLEAAEKAGLDASVVRTSSFPPAFVVPVEVEDKYHELFDEASDDSEDDIPKANASKKDWLAYAETHPDYDAETDAELGRDELREKFGPKD
jgi:hypothetical protein